MKKEQHREAKQWCATIIIFLFSHFISRIVSIFQSVLMMLTDNSNRIDPDYTLWTQFGTHSGTYF